MDKNIIPFSLVERYSSYDSNFVYFLFMEFGIETARRVVDDYALGAIDNKTILWNIGLNGEIFGGQAINFDRQGHIENGWRDNLSKSLSLTDASTLDWYTKETGYNNDIQSISDFLSPDLGTGDLPYKVIERPCLFGLHLLKMYPEKPIAITESLKSALIGYALQPQMNWLATGDVKDVDLNILRPLKGKRVMVFPTNHSYYDWLKVAKQVDFCQIVVSDMMEGYKSDWLRDIGDLLLDDFRRNGEQVKTKQESKSAIIVEISPKQKILNDMIASNPAIGTLVSNLNLQIV
jgi:hypothetical protein